MDNFKAFIDLLMNGDYFVIFLILIFLILFVLILALVKTKNQYSEIAKYENNNDILETNATDIDEFMDFKAESVEDVIDENKPLVKQIDVPKIMTYEEKLEEYENIDEENAVISAEELEKKTKERIDNLGVSDNQAAIQKYEEEQEKKAIISYEQLLKNASNISLTYKEEDSEAGSPKINKIEIQEKEVTPAENYLNEEEFLEILKEFRLSLE